MSKRAIYQRTVDGKWVVIEFRPTITRETDCRCRIPGIRGLTRGRTRKPRCSVEPQTIGPNHDSSRICFAEPVGYLLHACCNSAPSVFLSLSVGLCVK